MCGKNSLVTCDSAAACRSSPRLAGRVGGAGAHDMLEIALSSLVGRLARAVAPQPLHELLKVHVGGGVAVEDVAQQPRARVVDAAHEAQHVRARRHVQHSKERKQRDAHLLHKGQHRRHLRYLAAARVRHVDEQRRRAAQLALGARAYLADELVPRGGVQGKDERKVGAKTLLRNERLFDPVDDEVAPAVEAALVVGHAVHGAAAVRAHHGGNAAEQHLSEHAPLLVHRVDRHVVDDVDDHVARVREASDAGLMRVQVVLAPVRVRDRRSVDGDVAQRNDVLLARLVVERAQRGRLVHNVRYEVEHEVVKRFDLVAHEAVPCRERRDRSPSVVRRYSRRYSRRHSRRHSRRQPPPPSHAAEPRKKLTAREPEDPVTRFSARRGVCVCVCDEQ